MLGLTNTVRLPDVKLLVALLSPLETAPMAVCTCVHECLHAGARVRPDVKK